MVNSTPFQCGKYWMYYIPYADEANKYSFSDLSHITGYPGVELDLATSKSVELRIPLLGPWNPIDLTNRLGKFGNLCIDSLAGIKDGTSAATASATIFMWMEDVELTMPTKFYNLYAQGKHEAIKAAKSGLVSGFADSVGALANSTGKLFPGLSTITQPVTWAAGIASGVASYFGFSKPADLTAKTCVYDVPAKGYTQTVGPDSGVVLGCLPDNAIEVRGDVFGTDVDELSINYVTGRPCIERAFTWSNSQAANTVLSIPPVTPANSQYYSGICPTLLQYVACMFRYWHGSITYRLSVSKTAFHTGRIGVAYSPVGYNRDPELSSQDDEYKWVLDLSTSSELTFTVPWVSNQPWKRVGTDNRYGVNGYLYIYIVTPLNVASEAATPTVDVLLWHSGGEDIRFAKPDVSFTSINWGVPRSRTEPTGLKAQGLNEADQNVHAGNKSQDMFPYNSPDPQEACKASIGEEIVSLRSVMKRFTPSLRLKPPVTTVNDSIVQLFPDPAKNITSFLVSPYNFPVAENRFNCSAYGTNSGTQLSDPLDAVVGKAYIHQLSMISQIYRFVRGSVRYKYISEAPTSTTGNGCMPRVYAQATANAIQNSDPVLEESYAYTNIQNEMRNSFNHSVATDNNGACEITLPAYIATPCTVAAAGTMTGATEEYWANGARFYVQSDINFTSIPSSGSVACRLQWFPTGYLMVAAGEDMDFGFLGGAPRFLRYA